MASSLVTEIVTYRLVAKYTRPVMFKYFEPILRVLGTRLVKDCSILDKGFPESISVVMVKSRSPKL